MIKILESPLTLRFQQVEGKRATLKNSQKDRLGILDYMAGAMLNTGFIWFWAFILTNFSDLFSSVAPLMLLVISYTLYLIGEIVASYLVCKKAASGHFMIGLRLAALSWFFSLILITPPSLGSAAVLLICLATGGAAGAYLAFIRGKPSRNNPIHQ